MSNECSVAYYDEDDCSEKGPPELSHEDIKSSVFDFDPMFEFDAPQWFDFLDIKSLYCYGHDAKPSLEDGEWMNGEDWFAEVHEGHEMDWSGYPNDEDYCGGSIDDGLDFDTTGYITETPKKAIRPARNQFSPTQPSPSSLTSISTPSQPKRRPISSVLSPLASTTDSPLRSGAVRLRPDATMAKSNSSSSLASGDSISSIQPKKTTGPQRFLVQTSPPPCSPENSQSISAITKKPSYSNLSPISNLRKVEKTSVKSPTKPVEKVVVLPRYMETSKPTHQTQLPPRSMISRNNATNENRVTQRAPAANITKRHPSSTIVAAAPVTTPYAPYASKKSISPISGENTSSTENTLLKQVDSILAQQKQVKQRPVYEPRRFGIKEIKAWEQLSGLKWHELTVEERQIANEEMDEIRRTGSIVPTAIASS
jgi:hypothetical protein